MKRDKPSSSSIQCHPNRAVGEPVAAAPTRGRRGFARGRDGHYNRRRLRRTLARVGVLIYRTRTCMKRSERVTKYPRAGQYARAALWVALAWTMALSEAPAGDWPQILGPTRSGRAEGEQLSATWPEEG